MKRILLLLFLTFPIAAMDDMEWDKFIDILIDVQVLRAQLYCPATPGTFYLSIKKIADRKMLHPFFQKGKDILVIPLDEDERQESPPILPRFKRNKDK